MHHRIKTRACVNLDHGDTTHDRAFWQSMVATILIALTATNLSAATKTWTGGGGDDNWATANNWEGGVAPVDNADALIFAGANRLINTNTLTADSRFSSLAFATNAGAFVLNGNRIRSISLPMAFTNRSSQTQTINLNVDLLTRASYWDTYAGDLTVYGAITGTAASSSTSYSTLTKDGIGTLTLAGTNDLSNAAPGLKILNGKVVLDLNAGGSITPATVLQYGLTGSSGGDVNKQGGTLLVRGKASGTSSQTFGNMTIYDGTSLVRLKVDPNGGSGTTLTLGNTWTRTGNSYMNMDFSGAGAALISSPTTNASGIVGSWCTVTDTDKTGFAAVNAGNVVRNTTLYDWGFSNNSTNYRTSGLKTLSALTYFGTLTIQGGGSVTGIYDIRGGSAVLMEEGVSDYTNACAVFGVGAGNLFLHQYSTVGNLILNCGLAGNFYKTGPGAVVIQKNTATSINIEVYEGPLDLRAALTGPATRLRVFNGGILRGSGTFGTGNITNILTVFSGGTLVGTRADSNALTVNGSVILQARSNFSVDLANTAFNPLRVTGMVTNLGANLSLSLGYAPGGMDEITLLTTDTGFDGAFATVNGSDFGPNNSFSLTNNAEIYQFKLLTTSTSIVAQVVTKSGTLIWVR